MPDFTAMHQGNRPRDLRDISHLYLSSVSVPRERPAGSTALVLLASLEGGPLRAWLSAGLAVSFGSHGAAVTLLETGPGLPCAGYYFALEPGRFMRPVLDETAVVEADRGQALKIFYAREPSLLRGPVADSGGGHSVIILSFDRPAAGLRNLLDSVPALAHAGAWEELPASMLTVSSCPGAQDTIARDFGGLFPAAPVLALFPGGEKGEEVEGVDPCPFPEEFLESLGRRTPPSSAFMTGLAGEILQRLGSRRNGEARGGIR